MGTEKQALRALIRGRLRSLSAEEIEGFSARICEHIKTCVCADLEEGDGIALFGGLRNEPDLIPLISWMTGKGFRPYFFGIAESELVPCLIKHSDELMRGKMGVWEPKSLRQRLSDLSQLSVVLTPGLAFHPENGSRLGRGAGFYDRFFAKLGVMAQRVGVAFDCQILADVPTEPHDIAIQACVTESGFKQV